MVIDSEREFQKFIRAPFKRLDSNTATEASTVPNA